MGEQVMWDRYCRYLCAEPSLGMSLDISRMRFGEEFFERTAPAMEAALAAMAALEGGAIANPDEQRMVGHYWLRAPQLAPSGEIRSAIEEALTDIRDFVGQVHDGRLRPPSGEPFSAVLAIGIGGSALGPMFVHDALGRAADDHMALHFIDNTDPDGFERVLQALGDRLPRTLCVVTSKSGGTAETRNGMLHAMAAFESAGLDFARQAVAITGHGSALDQQARSQGWLHRFPMWDWVGGRTSELSAVGLLPAALQGVDISAMLTGAAACDAVTRGRAVLANPSALMALMWYHATGGKGSKDMVVLPYKDRLALLGRYLQQLIMESLGKRHDLSGRRVDQGLTVYGNKGSTDQHAYVQQLRDGVDNFFVTFIRVLESGGTPLAVQAPAITAGDFLHAFQLGTRDALFENGRQSMTLTITRVDAYHVGVLIALFERAVGLYGSLVGINPYHQPGVEAGKRAAAAVLDLQTRITAALSEAPQTAAGVAAAIGEPHQVERVYALLEYLTHNGRARPAGGDRPDNAMFCAPR